MPPRGLKIDFGAPKIDLWRDLCYQECSGSMMLTHFYRFLVDLGLPFGGYFGEQIVKKSVVFSMLFVFELLGQLLRDSGLLF